MTGRFDYRVCQVQQSRVTYVNGEWQGSTDVIPIVSRPGDSVESCPLVWEFLQALGGNGWELVAAIDSGVPGFPYQLLYLKRGAV